MRLQALFRWLAVLCTSMLLASCGGGGGGGGAPTPAAPQAAVMIDSYGNAMPSDWGQGGGDGAAGGDGTAGDGTPIPNAKVQIFDSSGKVATTTTDANGIYHVRIDGFVAPMVAVVTKADGSKWYSPSTTSPVKLGFIAINLTGLTDKIAYDVAVILGKSTSSQVTPADLAANTSALSTAKTNLNTKLSSLLTANGLDPSKFDPVTTVFVPNQTGYDKVLDSLHITNTGGPTVITPKHSVGGSISGLGSATGLQLSNGSDVLTVPANATGFTLSQWVTEGDTYQVVVSTQPAGMTCSVVNGGGTMGTSNVTNLSVNCVPTSSAGFSVFAGDLSQQGTTDGTGAAARFTFLWKVVTDTSGNMYGNDNGVLRKITPAGVVTTLAGGQVVTTTASDTSLAIDPSGNLYFEDPSLNGTIKKLTPAGALTTVGTGPESMSPMATDAAGNVYLSSFEAVFKMTPSGTFTLLAGSDSSTGFATGMVDATGSAARFNGTLGLAVDTVGNVFVADYYNNAIRRITPAGVVTTITTALNSPTDVAIFGNDLYIANSGAAAIVKITGVANTTTAPKSGPAVTTVASNVPAVSLTLNGSGRIFLGAGSALLAVP